MHTACAFIPAHVSSQPPAGRRSPFSPPLLLQGPIDLKKPQNRFWLILVRNQVRSLPLLPDRCERSLPAVWAVGCKPKGRTQKRQICSLPAVLPQLVLSIISQCFQGSAAEVAVPLRSTAGIILAERSASQTAR